MLPHVLAGRSDIERAAEALATRLPEPLGVFARIAYNYRWAWDPDGPATFAAIDPDRWEKVAENPVKLLQEAATDRLAAAANDGDLLARAAALEERISADLARPRRDEVTTPERPIAYFSAEYGFHGSFPIYSGGLGALAGDILKEASDRAWPLVAVGLLYRNGYFRQRIDAGGWQHEYWVDTDPDRLPAALVTGDDGQPITITVPIRDDEVTAQIWRVDVGGIPLYLLDAERPENSQPRSGSRARLYIGDEDTRLAQYMLLGIGGVRALEALGIEPGLVHLNEGHAAFVSLELARREYSGNGSLRRGAGDRPHAHDLHHAHAGPGGQRHLPRAAGRGDAGADRGHARRRRRGDHQPRPHQPGRGGRAVRRHAVRAAHEPRRQRRLAPPRRGRARDVAADVAGEGRRRRPDHLRHQRRAHPDLARRSRCGSC